MIGTKFAGQLLSFSSFACRTPCIRHGDAPSPTAGQLSKRPIERLRTYIKTALEKTLIVAGAPQLARSLTPRSTTILAYHNVVPDGSGHGDPSLHIPLRAFCAQLDELTRTHDVVPLGEALSAPGRRRRAVITFDDAYRGAVLCAVDELARRRLPATIFVAPGSLGGDFWWDVLRDEIGGTISEEWRTAVLNGMAGRDDLARVCARENGYEAAQLPPLARIASEAELDEAVMRHPGLTLGSHSWSHPNLTRLDAEELMLELTRPLEWLRSRFASVVPWIAYPYGLGSAAVSQAAAQAGYTGGLMVAGGRIRAPTDPFAVPRLNIPAGVSQEGFILRLSGVLRA